MEIEVMPVRIAATYAVIPHMLANPFTVIRHVTTDVYVPIDRTPGNPFINKDATDTPGRPKHAADQRQVDDTADEPHAGHSQPQ